MTFPIWHWHIENSSICSLRCPRCPRQEVPETLNQTGLSLDFFQRNFTAELLKDVWQITFCGDDGDPIYHPDFLDVVTYLKRAKPNISLRIVTNGSYKKTDWWFLLARALNQYDEIHFSLDGYNQESNQIYRVNSNWDSIMSAVKTVRTYSPVIMTWAAIAFNFNENHLFNTIYKTAQDLGFDFLQITKSTKFGSVYEHYYQDGDEPLEPYNTDLISKKGRFERLLFPLSNREKLINNSNQINLDLWDNIDKHQSIIPMCKIGNKGLYISADGYFYPCCWMANRYNHTQWQRFKQERFNLNKRTITDVLNDKSWQDFFAQLHTNAECNSKCNIDNYNLGYATQW